MIFCQKPQKSPPKLTLRGAFSVLMLFFEPYLPMQRNMKVTIWPRVQLPAGSKVVALAPVVMFSFTAHSTAFS